MEEQKEGIMTRQDLDASASVRADAQTPAAPQTPAQSNRWTTRQLVTMALLAAIGALLSFVEFPLFPAVPFLKYDASIVCCMVGGFAFGPGAGVAIGIVEVVIHGIIMADLPGSAMNALVTVGFVLPAALMYARHRDFRHATIGLVLGIICAIIMAIAGDLLIMPAYMGVPVNAVLELLIPAILPFNLIKHVLNAVITLAVYKSISNLITPKKKQVKGR